MRPFASVAHLRSRHLDTPSHKNSHAGFAHWAKGNEESEA
jgi:hypothetical protein